MTKNVYKGSLAAFMTYHHEKALLYNANHKCTSGEMEELLLQDLLKFFNFRACGMEKPTD